MSDEMKLPIPDDLKNVDPVKIKGLTIRQIRHKRALVLLQKEFCKEKMSFNMLKIKNSSPFSKNYSGKSRPFGRATGIAAKLINGLNYIDYAMIGYTMFNNIRRITSIFKKGKK